MARTYPRRSSGCGQEFSLAILADGRNKDFEDVAAGIDNAVEGGWAGLDWAGVGRSS